MSDRCEFELARQFAPVLVVKRFGCNWDSAGSRLGGGYLYAVQAVGSVVRVTYAPAYFRDCGWTGIKCWLPWVDCSPHAGDSELIVVELQTNSTGLSVTGVFLSAHCFGRSSGSCRWYRGTDLRTFSWEAGSPVVWVAEGRNANYPGQDQCDSGHHSVDTCDHHDFRYRFPVIPERNLGSRTRPLSGDGCLAVTELGLTSGVAADAAECFWTNVPFRGWQGIGKGVTPYNRYLSEVAGF